MFDLKRCGEAIEVRCRGGEEMEERRGKLCYVLGRWRECVCSGENLLRCLARWYDWKEIVSNRNCSGVNERGRSAAAVFM